MDILKKDRPLLPERVLQFGEGNFLRGFIDWMLQRMNDQGLFNGSAVVVNPLPGPNPLTPYFQEQNCCYTVLNRGVQNGQVINEKEIIQSVSRFLGSYEDFDAYMACAANPELRFIISNTTEAGIAYAASDRFEDRPASSYPGKITQFLHARWSCFNGATDKGLILMPCELIEANGSTLRSIVLRYASDWNLDPAFAAWVQESCIFLNTLVDRIVSGYPRAEETAIWSELGYVDHLMDAVEPFHLLVIEGPDLSEELPLHKAGINVVWTADQSAYRTRKVRILNGAHTMTTLGAYLAGLNTVEDFMKDSAFSAFMRQGLYEEIIPTMTLPKEELMAFAAAVEERFLNPFLNHQLMSIALNSVSKWKTRVLPSLLDQYALNGAPAPSLSFSLAALIVFYRGLREDGTKIAVPDSAEVVAFFEEVWKLPLADCVTAVLARVDFWGQDLNSLEGFTAAVTAYVASILEKGVRNALPVK